MRLALPPELDQVLQARARRNRRTIQNEIVVLLMACLGLDDDSSTLHILAPAQPDLARARPATALPRGVSIQGQRFVARFQRRYLGSFSTAEEAAAAYVNACGREPERDDVVAPASSRPAPTGVLPVPQRGETPDEYRARALGLGCTPQQVDNLLTAVSDPDAAPAFARATPPVDNVDDWDPDD